MFQHKADELGLIQSIRIRA